MKRDQGGMKREKRETADVTKTAGEGLCTGCGICAAVCPVSCIRFERKGGNFLPVIDETGCVHCGKCLRVCPGYSHTYGQEPEDVVKAEKEERMLCLSAQAKNTEILKNASSGGIITTLVQKLINNGCYDTAFLVRGYNYEEQVKVSAVRRGDDFEGTQKSRYLPVSQEPAVDYILKHPEEKIIYVGTGCAVHGLLSALHQAGRGRENLLLIGLFCDKTMNYSIYEYVKRMKRWNSPVTCFHFRDKRAGGWPGNMRLEFADGTHRHISAKERMILKDFCQVGRCLYCLDKLNGDADLSVGDNYTGKNASKDGSGSLIVRTENGREAWDYCRFEFQSYPSRYEDIWRSQHMDEKISQYRNNLLYASAHGGRRVEQGVPADLRGRLDVTQQAGSKEVRHLKKQLDELSLGEREAFRAIRLKKEKKRIGLYRKALLARIKGLKN